MSPTSAPRNSFNEADLRYLRGALRATTDARRASEVAATCGRDPSVRALALRTGTAQAEDILTITSMLVDGVGESPRPTGLSPDDRPATLVTELRSDSGAAEVDCHFIEVMTAHAEASLVGARTELLEGFGPSTRRHAEDSCRTSWRDLAALALLDGPRAQ